MSGGNHPQNSKFNNLQDVTATIYITNFPPSVESKDLWKQCNNHGTVADVYIARKLSKAGRRFAFVRFLKSKNNESLIQDLNKIWIGSYHLFADLAKFEKKSNISPKPNVKPSSHEKPLPSHAHSNPNRSYVSALNGNEPTKPSPQTKTILKSITLDASDLIDTSDTKNAILAKVRDVHLIPNINTVLNKEGFFNFHCKYIGGLWLWIEFDSHDSCLKLQSNNELSWYFTQVKHIHHSFVMDERVVWIEISGLPLNAWSPKVFKKTASIWGSPLFVDKDPNETVSIWQRKAYNVSVNEFADWNPDIQDTDSLSSINTDKEHSVKQEDGLSDNGFLDKEEGEIPNFHVNEEEEFVKNTQWSEEGVLKQEVPIPVHSPLMNPDIPNEEPKSFSKPPGFEAFHSNSKSSSVRKPHASYKQPSHFSSAPVKSSRSSKSQTKPLNNHGSMIEAFVSHIEMGKVLGYDMEGANKCKAISKLCIKHKISFLGIQETHITKLNPFKVRSAWGNSQFDFAERPSSGRSGGIVSIWDPKVFAKNNVFHSDNFLIVEGTWIASNIHCFMINIYAPQDTNKKELLWNEIREFMNNNRGLHLLFGDFNEVRSSSERIGTMFNPSSANTFNHFIRDSMLWDIPLGGHLFTRLNKRGDKLSKLDRFLASDSFVPFLQNVSGKVLECHVSDHRPILLSPMASDFGPVPFKFYNSWLLDKDLHSCIIDFWNSYCSGIGTNPIVSFKNKMKALKTVIKDWSLNRKNSQNREKEELVRKIISFDADIISRPTDFVANDQRSNWVDSLRKIEVNEAFDFSQKAKIKWCIEADENSKFFHAMVNQKRRYLSIHGIKVDGHWIEEPLGIKEAFTSFFENKFKSIEVTQVINRSPFYKSLSSEQSSSLDSSISPAEIKNAIWDCGSDKSPGPDGFTFAFYKEFWSTIKDDVVNFVQHFFTSGSMPKGCNSSFITLIPKTLNPLVVSDFRPISLIGAQYKIIAKVLANRLARVIDSIISHEQSAFIKHRQILDGPLMVNEVIQWCKRKNSKLMVFKVDFEKAFDSISWDFLIRVMHFMGFSDTWINWISGCLNSAATSVLVNGSPSREFSIQRGLRQGDPLSPLLFIIAMEGLHVAMEDAMAAGYYNGFSINTLNLSHLFFADDALFIGEWSRSNIKNLVSILDCFHKVSGLKINYHKSKLFGVGVSPVEVSLLASITGCNPLGSPFTYLGLPIDCNMARVNSWDPVVEKFSNRLSNWKASLLSIGGRATLITSVLGALGTYFFSLFPMPSTVNKKLETLRSNFFWGSADNSHKIPWISWNVVLASKDKGGLGIGSLYSLNHALIQKWRWRFLTNPHALWARLITAIHGRNSDSTTFFSHIKTNGVWPRIVGSINSMHEKNHIPLSSMKRQVNNGSYTKFWYDSWAGSTPLKSLFPRLFHLAVNKDCLVRDYWNNGWCLNWIRNISSGPNVSHLHTLQNILSTITLNDSKDVWTWSVGGSTFTVKSARYRIDQGFLPDHGHVTRWNNLIPKKINIFIWRALRDRLPSR
ncbi:RNA-directed DNA polymerase, eukaryota [Tanacetum coccineum]